jgi:uncharacterized repeat protein (TIGR01451 family)
VVVYSLSFANRGSQGATGVTLTEVVPDGTTFDPDASTTGWQCTGTAAGSDCTLSVGALSPGASDSALFVVAVDAVLDVEMTEIANTARILDDGANGVDQAPADNVSTTLTSLNRPPVALAGGPYTVVEGEAVTLDGSASYDPDGGVLTFEWDFDADGDFDDATGPAPSFDGVDGPADIMVSLRVVDGAGLIDTDTAIVRVVNRDPEATASVASRTVQYSDAVEAMSFSASDVRADTPEVVGREFSLDGGSFQPGLPHGLELRADGCAVLSSTICGWTVDGTADVAPGTYTLRVSIADDDGGTDSVDLFVTVVAEDATVGFDPANPEVLAVTSAGGETGPFSLAIDVSEVDVPDDVVGDGNLAGDIETALVEMSLVPTGPGASVGPLGPCRLTTAAGTADPDSVYAFDTLTVDCDFDLVPVNSYEVRAVVGGHYVANAGAPASEERGWISGEVCC